MTMTNEMRKEYGEAIAAGEEVLMQADEVLQQLDKAKKWGFLDIFLNGGFLSAMAKYSRMDEAEAEIRKLRKYLQKFNRELGDVQVYDEVGDIAIDEFTKIADFFFDNPFTDWMAVSKIDNARKRVTELKEEVIQTLDILYREEGLL